MAIEMHNSDFNLMHTVRGFRKDLFDFDNANRSNAWLIVRPNMAMIHIWMMGKRPRKPVAFDSQANTLYFILNVQVVSRRINTSRPIVSKQKITCRLSVTWRWIHRKKAWMESEY